jgi:hypothetical protein
MIIPEGFAQVNAIFSGEGLPTGGEVTLGLGLSDPELTPAIVAEVYGTIFSEHILPNLGTSVVLEEVLCKFGPVEDGPSATFPVGDPGGTASAGASPAVAYLVQKQTALGGRQHRGRWYLPGVVEAEVSNAGVVGSGQVDNLNSDLVAFLADLETANIQGTLLHSNLRDPETGEEIPDSAAEPDPITSMVCQGVAATQRRRQRR